MGRSFVSSAHYAFEAWDCTKQNLRISSYLTANGFVLCYGLYSVLINAVVQNVNTLCGQNSDFLLLK